MEGGSCTGKRDIYYATTINGFWTVGFEGYLLGFSMILVAVSIHVFLSRKVVARSPDHPLQYLAMI
jgi:hypothetical protein